MRIGRWVMTACVAMLSGCGGVAQVPIEAGYGPNPTLPPPEKSLVPTVLVADATGWPAGGMPTPGAGLSVQRFAGDLDHPRWLHVLPNGVRRSFLEVFHDRAGGGAVSDGVDALLACGK